MLVGGTRFSFDSSGGAGVLDTNLGQWSYRLYLKPRGLSIEVVEFGIRNCKILFLPLDSFRLLLS